ncbi:MULTISPECIES: pyridoxal phosphate-dependent aminotransferase [unclassified Enterococcus]|uniref:pyridoxal phosphate-dependent aminotransferase n=1 Tax=unclassified Enterococcus TaxID=2608891 RepID=UPI0015563A3E|nr:MULTISPECIES: pyridoxal phosphate-dependent aminotransferase [unclassified Enterococcus]MBS7577171.1 pyridoxal phosphate-dependent aminotransferase [Enterococcus sp. MMGLQ5-2]MBS7584736.1 pyridoxal phosphate-dependent aminotransferase [Enterococcus sp. MMGLQ5-1]NPD12591.1 pyridoxal phosphate-dependent aminotransferase [Enterococcus sp. MMGLQ5-1]NPD37005.1 pyridoxal phosphate-dependent aminotransferase [Enterococcus sp. MMGLQ5-2]
MILSERAKKLKSSVTLAASAKANALKAAGEDILTLTVGEPDFATPKNIQDAAITAIQSGKASYYTPTAGIPALKEAIIAATEKDYGFKPESQNIIVTDGAKFALYTLFQVILNPADEIIIPTPYWVSYGEQVSMAEGVPVFVKATRSNHFKVSVAQLEAARTEKTKAVIINSPSNPTGAIYSKEELTQIGNWAVENNVLIISDDIYGKLVYNGAVFTPLASISEAIQKQTVIINGVSKAYAMTGWRIGYAIADEKIISAMTKIASQSTSNPTAVSQYAAVEALNGSQEMVETMRQAFEARLNEVYPLVAAIPGFKIDKPQGAFYLFPDVTEAMKLKGFSDINEFTNAILTEAKVALVTGAGFGAPENIRMSYATDLETLKEAVKRIKAFMEK